MKELRYVWIALAAMALLSPLGLYLPQVMRAGAAWGEWGLDEIKHMVGYAPAGMEKAADTWRAPLLDYAFPGQEDSPLLSLSLSYILSAFVGIAACAGATVLLMRWLGRGKG